jgi:triacylglycerol lipase
LFDGRNDGLVGEASFAWGTKYAFLDMDLPRGISHADMIDLNRENISGFDVREFYVQLVADLKRRGF